MGIFDWLIFASVLLFLTWSAFRTMRYQKSVADFLVANRCAGRYMLGVAEGIAGLGAITVIASFEAYYEGGFSLIWWGVGGMLIAIVTSLSGWVVYRYRETRAMTLAQLLETRYSKGLRIFAGILIFVSGTLNFGIFPAVGARFFQHFCQLPVVNVQIFEWLTIDVVYGGIILFFLAVALMFTFLSGQISIMMTDFIQGVLFNIFFCGVLLFLVFKMPWQQVYEVLARAPENQSMLHPFRSGEAKNFNVWFYVIQTFGIFYSTRAWQGNQGYFGAALNAHEARMGSILGMWRQLTQFLMVFIIPILAYVYLRHSDYTALSKSVNGYLGGIEGKVIQKQLTTTIFLAKILPAGLLGAFAAAMSSALIANAETYLHSWGSIFIQDVVGPIRKKPFEPKKQILYLKISIMGVAAFAFLFSLLFPQNDYIFMFFAMTGTIWLGGAGAIIIGGLYWKKGTTIAAYSALIVGVIVAVLNFTLPRIWQAQGKEFPINSQWLWFIAMLGSISVYVIVSLVENKNYDLDKLLHRGKYRVEEESRNDKDDAGNIVGWQRAIGINKSFKLKDKIEYLFIATFFAVTFLVFVVGTIYNLFFDVSQETWATCWHAFIWGTVAVCVGTTIWYLIGGIKDMKNMFRRLSSDTRDNSDNGSVERDNN